MKLSPHQWFYLTLAIAVIWLAYLVRSMLLPFILAAGFAYLLNPWVSFLTNRVKLSRGLAITIIYMVLIAALGGIVIFVGRNLIFESQEFSRETRVLMDQANTTIKTLPDWLQPLARDSFQSARSSLLIPQRRITMALPGAVSRTVNVLVFVIASFYFLRDGQKFIRNFLDFLPAQTAREGEIILQKINAVLGNYLRGQLFLVVIMSTLTYIGLSIIGVRYALIISVFTGFAEIIPYVGPVVAAIVAMGVAFTDQASRFNLVPMLDLVAVGSLYFVLRQMEDLFIIPQVLGRLTKLHPLVVLFVVLAGGQVFGLIGFVTAVPVVASLKVVAEHFHRLVEKTTKKSADFLV